MRPSVISDIVLLLPQPPDSQPLPNRTPGSICTARNGAFAYGDRARCTPGGRTDTWSCCGDMKEGARALAVDPDDDQQVSAENTS